MNFSYFFLINLKNSYLLFVEHPPKILKSKYVKTTYQIYEVCLLFDHILSEYQLWKNVIIQQQFDKKKFMYKHLLDLKGSTYKYKIMLFLLVYKSLLPIHKQHNY